MDYFQPLDAHAAERARREEGVGGGGNDREETITRRDGVLYLNAEVSACDEDALGWSKPGTLVTRERPDYIHACGETIDTLRTFRDAFLQRGGLLVVRTFNEGEEFPNRKTRQHVVTPNDGRQVSIAVIRKVEQREDERCYSFVMVTMDANKLIGTASGPVA